VGTFLIAGSDPSVLFEAVDQSLDSITLTVDRAIEGASTGFITLARDGVADAATTKICSVGTTAVPLVTNNALRPELWSSRSGSLYCSSFHQRLEKRCLMALAWADKNRDRLSFPFTAEVNLCAEATTTVP
jgi:hypothetical protein